MITAEQQYESDAATLGISAGAARAEDRAEFESGRGGRRSVTLDAQDGAE